MHSYFIRHTRALLVDEEDLRQLWEEDRIAVHYPDHGNTLQDEDNESTDPAHYEGRGKTAMRYLREMEENGGYVWTESFVSPNGDAKVGKVEPGTPIEVREARWELRGHADYTNRQDGDTAILKTLKLSSPQIVSRNEQVGLRAGKPRQGTIAKWDVGTRLEALVEGKIPEPEWSNLSTAQQEAACAEFLRLPPEGCAVPKLHRLLLPVGRTLQDIDLHGLAEDGREIFAQVTYHSRDSSAAQEKVNALKTYGGRDAYLVFFCRGKGPKTEDGITFVPVESKVMGWLNNEPHSYRAALFEGA